MFRFKCQIDVISICVLATVISGVQSDTTSSRQRRQMPITAGDACLQIYSVPRRTVRCQPTAEVVQEIERLHQTVNDQDEVVSKLLLRLEEIENSEKRETINDCEMITNMSIISEIKADYQMLTSKDEVLSTRMRELEEKTAKIESTEKQEMMNLLATQMELITASIAHTNHTYHQSYVQKMEHYWLRQAQEIQEHKNLTTEMMKEAREKCDKRVQQQENVLQTEIRRMDQEITSYKSMVVECKNETVRLTQELALIKEEIDARKHITPRVLRATDCQSLLLYYKPVSGVYSIYPNKALTTPVQVYCHMVSDNEGWTVILRRQDGSTDFFRGWEDYRRGFGDKSGEYWLGLEVIYHLTNSTKYSLRVELEDWRGEWKYAEYETFSIADEQHDYMLSVDGYHGNAGDSLSYHTGEPFSTNDRNNDKNRGICASWCHGAWWYKDCFHSNLNGRYYGFGPYTTATGWGDGVVWRSLKNTNFFSLKSAVMKIKPNL